MWDGTNWVRPDPDGITQAFADARYLQIATAASTYLALSGGTLTGDLTLVGVPTTNNMAATKGYVDTQIASIPAATDLTPAGTVIWTARSSAPTGYLKANGAAVSRSPMPRCSAQSAPSTALVMAAPRLTCRICVVSLSVAGTMGVA
jgi:hypothetical protein